MNRLSFQKPKGAAFGISRSYYLSVLTGMATMPAINQVFDPKGADGKMPGFAVPLKEGSDKDALSRAMERGAYAFASPDRKTVLRTYVMSKEEARFDPTPFLQSEFARTLDKEVVDRIAATWMVVQMTFESHDPMVHPALQFALGCARALSQATNGVVADPISQSYKLPTDVLTLTADGVTAAQDVVSVHEVAGVGGSTCRTLGLQKFGLPELEVTKVNTSQLQAATRLLYGVSQTILRGQLLTAGDVIGDPAANFVVANGGTTGQIGDGQATYELIPHPGVDINQTLFDWHQAVFNA